MKRDLEIERQPPGRQTQTRSISKRTAHTAESELGVPSSRKPPGQTNGDDGAPTAGGGEESFERAPDLPENEGIAPVSKPKRQAKTRNRRHGRRR
jgi:hypothetical protein